MTRKSLTVLLRKLFFMIQPFDMPLVWVYIPDWLIMSYSYYLNKIIRDIILFINIMHLFHFSDKHSFHRFCTQSFLSLWECHIVLFTKCLIFTRCVLVVYQASTFSLDWATYSSFLLYMILPISLLMENLEQGQLR